MDKIFNVQAKERELNLDEVNEFLRYHANYKVVKVVPLIQNVAMTGPTWNEKYSNYGVIIVVSDN